MAEAVQAEMEEEITCSIHMEVFVDPMMLPCMHTLCQKDVEDLLDRSRDDRLACPLCNKVCREKDIQRDFRMIKMIDLHNKLNNPGDLPPSKLMCDFCNKQKSSEKCQQCNMMFCGGCIKGHKKMLPDHKTTSIETLKDSVKNELQQLVRNLNKTGVTIEECLHACRKCDHNLEVENEKVLTELNKAEKEATEMIQETFQHFRKEVSTHISKRQESINKEIINLQDKRTTLEESAKLLKKTIQENKAETLLDEEFVSSLRDKSKTREEKPKEYVKLDINSGSQITFRNELKPETLQKMFKLSIQESINQAGAEENKKSPFKEQKSNVFSSNTKRKNKGDQRVIFRGCKSCSKIFVGQNDFCLGCSGKTYKDESKKSQIAIRSCSFCNSPVDADDLFCAECGQGL